MKIGAIIGTIGASLMFLSGLIGTVLYYNQLKVLYLQYDHDMVYNAFLSSFFTGHLPNMIMSATLFVFCFTFYNQLAKKDGRN